MIRFLLRPRHPSVPFLLLATLMFATFAMTGVSRARVMPESDVLTRRPLPASHAAAEEAPVSPADAPQSSLERAVHRARKRIERRFGFTLSLSDLEASVRQQRALLARSLTVTFTTDDGTEIAPLTLTPESVMAVSVTPGGMQSGLSSELIGLNFAAGLPEGIRLPENATLMSLTTEEGVQKAVTEGVAKSGYDFDAAAVAVLVAGALENGVPQMTVPLKTVHGKILNATGGDLGPLELIASGRSDFEGSGNGRKANVRKGINRYLHNTIVPAGEKFGINSVLKHVPISEWEMALGIFGGGELRPVAGGGLCQVATTLYRAILGSGYPVVSRANHSLFVTYYEKYGVGIDATIFPGQNLDLSFVNTSPSPLLIQAYTEGDEAMVNFYGASDGRTVVLDGPYFAASAPEDFVVNGKALRKNEIAWKQRITYADGTEETRDVVSRYKAIPLSIVKKYMHAAAPEEPAVPALTANLQAAR